MSIVLIYTETGPGVGLGHIVRMSHLARELRGRGAEVGTWPHRPTSAGAEMLHRGVGMGPSRADVGIVDVMHWEPRWIEGFQNCVERLVVIVGAGQANPAATIAHLAVYQTGWAVEGQPSGWDHLILAPGYQSPLADKKHDALVVFGAGIPWGYAKQVALDTHDLGLSGTLVVPPYHQYEFDYTKLGLRAVRSPASLHGLQASHRIQVGSFGMSTYESVAARCLPVVVGRSEDHVSSANRVMTMGGCLSAGLWNEVKPEALAKLARAGLAALPELGPRMPKIDGRGAERVAKAILELA